MLAGKKLAILGVGKLGEALVSGLLAKTDGPAGSGDNLSAGDIVGTVRHAKSQERVRQKLSIQVGTDNRAAVKGADLVIIAVKPQNMDSVLAEIRDVLTAEQLVISVAASVSTGFIEERLKGDIPVIRAMPNTPALLNVGMTALCKGKNVSESHSNMADFIFKCVGETVFLEENLMDGVTALSASGPAYLYVVIESLAEAGVKLGIPRETSTLLAAQTMLGASRMVLSSKSHPAVLKDTVTTPAGCTVDGLMELEEGKLRVTLIKAVLKAADRARELVNTQNGAK